jgi:hypothetical protein
MSLGQTPVDDNARSIVGWDPNNHVPAVPDIQNTSLDGSVRHGPISVDVSVEVNGVTSSSESLTQVTAQVTNQPLLAANPNRKGAYVFNNSTGNLYLAFGTVASATAFTVKIAASGYYELPTSPVWQGALSGIWDAANGNAQITEVS